MKKHIQRLLSFCLVLCMVLSLLPAQALAAFHAEEAEAYGEAASRWTIEKDGEELTLDQLLALLEEDIDLSEQVTIDGTTMPLSDVVTMLEIEAELYRLEQTYFNPDVELTEEHLQSVQSLQEQIETYGIITGWGEYPSPSGIDHDVTLSASMKHLNSDNGEAYVFDEKVLGTILAVLHVEMDELADHDVTFLTRTLNGSAVSGTHYVGSEVPTRYTINNSGYSEGLTVVTVDLIRGADWSGYRTFYIEISHANALFKNGTNRISIPVHIRGTKECVATGEPPTVESLNVVTGTYGLGSIVPVVVTFSEPVFTEDMRLMINGESIAPEVTDAPTEAVVFPYPVRLQDGNVLEIGKLTGIKDLAGNTYEKDYENKLISAGIIQPVDLSNAVRAGSITFPGGEAEPKDKFAEVVFTMPEEAEYANLLSGLTEDAQGRFYCSEIYASTNAGASKLPIYFDAESETYTMTVPLPEPVRRIPVYAIIELYSTATDKVIQGIYGLVPKKPCFVLNADSCKLIRSKGFPYGTIYVEDIPDTLNLSIEVSNSVEYTWADTSKVTVYREDGTLPEGDFDFAWNVTDPSIASITENGDIVLTGKIGTTKITLTAFNDRYDDVLMRDDVTISVDTGYDPFLGFPASAKTLTIRSGNDAVVRWTSNLTDKNDENFPGAETKFTVRVYRITAEGKKIGVSIQTLTLLSTKENPVYSATLEGLTELSVGDTPSYCVVVSGTFLGDKNTSARNLQAEANVIVLSKAAEVNLTPPSRLYITDAVGEISVPWSVEHLDMTNAADFKLSVFDHASGDAIFRQTETDVASGVITFPISGGDFRNIYTVELGAKNKTESTWSFDSFVLYVYNDNMLSMMFNGEATDGTETLSNIDRISRMSQDEILALSRDIPLQAGLSINNADHPWGNLSDRMIWNIQDEQVAGLSTKVGSYYEDIRSLPYTSYGPGSQFMVSGLKDGTTRVSAHHVLVGEDLGAKLELEVETLQDKLYLFQFYPAAVTKIHYNGKTVQSNAAGEAAIYEPDGIQGAVYVESVVDGEIYFGSITNESLVSQERDATSLELYPVNTLKLRLPASVPLKFVDENNDPITGPISVRGGVYRNGEYCAGAKLNQQLDGVTTDYVITPDKNGIFTFRYDISQFTSEANTSELRPKDEVYFLFEFRAKGCTPLFYAVNGNLNERTVIRTDQRTVTFSPMGADQAGKPFINAQTVYYNSVAKGSSTDLTGKKGKVGPSGTYPEVVLTTTVLWPDAANAESKQIRMVDEYGIEVPGQTLSIQRYPFSTITVLESQALLNRETLEEWGLLNVITTRQLFVEYKTDLNMVKKEQTGLRVINMLDLDPMEGDGLIDYLGDMTQLMTSNKSNGLNLDGGMTTAGLKAASSMSLDTGVLKVILAPTADPTVFRALFYAGISNMNNDNVSKFRMNDEELTQDIDYMPGLDQIKGVFRQGLSGYASTAKTQTQYAFNILKNNVMQGSGTSRTGDSNKGYTLTGHFEAEIYYDFDTQTWKTDILTGGFTAGGGFGYEWTFNSQVGPVPVVAQLGAGIAAQVNFEVANDHMVHESYYLTTLRINAYLRAFGGIGFDYAVIALKIGLFGQVDFEAQLRWLNKPKKAEADFGYNIKLDGEIGVLFAARLLFFSYEKILWSERIPTLKWIGGKWSDIEKEWSLVSSGRSGNEYGIVSGSGGRSRLLALDEASGMALYESPSIARLESRDYLDNYTRSWNQGGMRTRALDPVNGIPGELQSNAYPNAEPQLADDGSMLLYLDDQENPDLTQTRVAVSMLSGGSYQKGKVLHDGGYGDSQPSIAGTGTFAAAAWTRLSEDRLKKEAGSIVTADEQALMMNATEIMVSVYENGTWTTQALTANMTADMAPVVAVSGNRAIVAWRSVASNNSKQLVDFNGEDRIVYSVYESGSWSEIRTLYNGTSGAVKGIDAAMLSDGTAAIAYTLKKGTDPTDISDLEVVYAIVDSQNEVVRNVQLTSDSYTDENPQLAVTQLRAGEGESFVLAWHSLQDANGLETHDIRLAAFDGAGNIVADFVDSLSDLVRHTGTKLSAGFRMTKHAGTLNELSILWREPALEAGTADNGVEAEHDVLTALRFIEENGVISVTAAQEVAQMPDATTLDCFDAYVTDQGTIKAVLLGTTYDFKDLEVVGVVTDENGEETQILLPKMYTGMYTATLTYQDQLRLDEVIADYQVIHRGSSVPIQFQVTNMGTRPVEKVTIQIDDQSFTVEALERNPILPGEQRTLTVFYVVGQDEITDPTYTLTPYFSNVPADESTGLIPLNVPDLGISSLELRQAADGTRTIRLSAYNDSDSVLTNSRRTVRIGFYADPACTIEIDSRYLTPVVVTDAERELVDQAKYTAQVSFDLAEYLKQDESFTGEDGEVREGGITLFARVWAEETDPESSKTYEVGEYYTQNNTRTITLNSLIDPDSDEKVTMTSTLETLDEGTRVTVDLQNNSILEQANGNLIVTLLDEAGSVVDWQQSYSEGGMTELAGEQRRALSFDFDTVGTAVHVTYSDLIADADVAELSTLSFQGIPLSLADFTYDDERDVYTASASTRDFTGTLVTAVAKSNLATVSVNDSEPVGNLATELLSLAAGIPTVITVEVTAHNGNIAVYELTVDNHSSTSALAFTVSDTSPVYGDTVELTAQVKRGVEESTSALPTGTLAIYLGEELLCEETLVDGGPVTVTLDKDQLPSGAGGVLYTAHAEYSGDALYEAAAETLTFTVTQKPLTMSVENMTGYVGALPAPVLTVEGFVDGEGLDDLNGAEVRHTAQLTSPAGNYTIEIFGTSDNYLITRTNGVLTLRSMPLEAELTGPEDGLPAVILAAEDKTALLEQVTGRSEAALRLLSGTLDPESAEVEALRSALVKPFDTSEFVSLHTLDLVDGDNGNRVVKYNGTSVVRLPYPEDADPKRGDFIVLQLRDGQISAYQPTPEDGYLTLEVEGELGSFLVCWAKPVEHGILDRPAPWITVTASSTVGGTVTPALFSLRSGESVTLTITPEEGYKIQEILVNGKPVAITTKLELTQLKGATQIHVRFAAVAPVEVGEPLPFVDVNESAWYYDAVRLAYENGYLRGVSEDRFAPETLMTRAMMLTVLARIAGEDTEQGATWYSAAVEWAKAQGISDGTMLESPITREQLATMLYRFEALQSGETADADSTDYQRFLDAGEVSDWAREGIAWAVEQGILEGSAQRLRPTQSATRAEVATMLMRFLALEETKQNKH